MTCTDINCDCDCNCKYCISNKKLDYKTNIIKISTKDQSIDTSDLIETIKSTPWICIKCKNTNEYYLIDCMHCIKQKLIEDKTTESKDECLEFTPKDSFPEIKIGRDKFDKKNTVIHCIINRLERTNYNKFMPII